MIDITELNAVNMMLESVGETKVTSLSGTLPTDVSNAQSILSEVNAEFQMQGWSFNRRIKVSIAPDGSSPYRTYLPYSSTSGDQVLPVPLMVTARDRSKKYGIRRETSGTPKKWYLYDINEDTDALGKTIEVDMVVGLQFEELPHPARNYVARSASRLFAERMFGEASPILRQDEAKAYALFERYETETMDYRMSDTGSVDRAIRRSPYEDYRS